MKEATAVSSMRQVPLQQCVAVPWHYGYSTVFQLGETGGGHCLEKDITLLVGIMLVLLGGWGAEY